MKKCFPLLNHKFCIGTFLKERIGPLFPFWWADQMRSSAHRSSSPGDYCLSERITLLSLGESTAPETYQELKVSFHCKQSLPRVVASHMSLCSVIIYKVPCARAQSLQVLRELTHVTLSTGLCHITVLILHMRKLRGWITCAVTRSVSGIWKQEFEPNLAWLHKICS